MADTTSPSSDIKTESIKSKRSPRDDRIKKKQKTELARFSDGKSLVTFIVGPDPNPTEFLIHKEVVFQQSEVLAAAFNSGFKDGQTQTYRIEDTTVRAFRLFMQWLYSHNLTGLQVDPDYEYDENDDEEDELEDAEDMSLPELWVLADKFGMPCLQNAALEAIHSIMTKPSG
ncbi:hypothetical protein DL98DRAFT_605275 [Cadophora sp. DSE1049]|nr:hypothetical protein DL98DRAFT_605275 [Cadophora sp. DSE1049]